jgi:hypothetical protein
MKTKDLYVELSNIGEHDGPRLLMKMKDISNKVTITLKGKELKERLDNLLNHNETGSNYTWVSSNGLIEEYKMYITENIALYMNSSQIGEFYAILTMVKRYIQI